MTKKVWAVALLGADNIATFFYNRLYDTWVRNFSTGCMFHEEAECIRYFNSLGVQGSTVVNGDVEDNGGKWYES